MTDNQWRLLFGAVSAVCAFILTQPDVAVPAFAKLALGCIVVALSVINPNRSVDTPE